MHLSYLVGNYFWLVYLEQGRKSTKSLPKPPKPNYCQILQIRRECTALNGLQEVQCHIRVDSRLQPTAACILLSLTRPLTPSQYPCKSLVSGMPHLGVSLCILQPGFYWCFPQFLAVKKQMVLFPLVLGAEIFIDRMEKGP